MSIIRADSIKNRAGNGAPDFPNGLTVTGVVTTTTLNANVTGDLTVTGNVGVGGTITYEDVTNVDSVGIVTARSGIKIGPTAGVAATIFSDGSINTTGIITATTVKVGSAVSMTDGAVSATRFHGNGAQLTGIVSGILQVKQVKRTDYQTSSGSWADITGLSITITPTAATTQMMLIPNISTYHASGSTQYTIRIVSSNSTIEYVIGDFWSPGSGVSGNITQFYLDDHNTTNAITYKIQHKDYSGDGGINKDWSGNLNGVSTFTVIEIDSSVIS